MAAKEKFDRKDLKEPDQFFETVGRINRYLEENKAQAILIACAVLGAFLVSIGAGAYFDRARTNSAAAFARAVNNIEFDSPGAARAGFSGLTEMSNAGTYGELARLYKADLAGRAGDYDEALSEYDAFLASADESYLRQAALMGKAFVAESSGDGAAAVSLYAEAGQLDGPYTKQGLEAALRVADKAGDDKAALSAVERLLELNLPGTDSEALSQRLTELKGGKA